MPLDEYGNEIQEEEEPQPVLPERKNKYTGLWDVPGLPMSPQVDTVTGEPLKKNKYSGIWDSVPTPPPMPPKKSPREMMELATKAGRIPSTNIVKDLVKKYTEPGYVSRMGTGEYWKAAGGNLLKSAREFVPGMAKLAAETIEPIIRPGHFIIERGMERAAAKKAKEMGVEPTKGAEGKTWLPVKNLADLALWGPKTLAKVIQDPVGMIENQPLDVLFLASIGLKRPLTKALDVNPLSSKDFGGILKEVATEHPEFQIPDATRTALVHIGTKLAERPVGFYITPEGKAISSAIKPIELTKPGAIKTGAMPKEGVAPIPDTAGVIPKEQMPVIPGLGEVKGLGIEFVDDAGRPISRAEAFRGRQAKIEPSAEEPGKMKAVISPLPPIDDHVAIVQNAIKEAFPIRRGQETLYHAEMQKRTAGVVEAGKIPGEVGFYAKLGELKGPLPKVEFESIRGKISQENIDGLFNMIQSHPELSTLDKVSAGEGLAKLFGEFGGGIPQPKQLMFLEKVFGSEFVKTVSNKTPLFKQWKSIGLDIANIPRAYMASFDLSFGLRQGVVMAATHPAIFWKNFPKQFKWFASEKAFNSSNAEIASRPTFDLMNESKLSLTNMGKSMAGREEPFQSPLAEKVPIAGQVVKASNRAYSGFANRLRADVFDYLVKRAETAGRDPYKDTKLAKDIATVVNTGTGRGSLGKFERAGPALNAFFFSPKLMASRLQMLNAFYYGKLDKFARVEALKQLASTAGAGITIMGLAKKAGAEVGTDWRSADFGKIKIGNTRFDIGGGFLQYFRTFGQLWTGQVVSSTTGKVSTLGEGYKPRTRLDILLSAIEYKTAPVASFAISLLKGQESFGGEFKLGSEIANRFIPMVIQDMVDVYKDDPSILPLSALGIFGVGLQTYSPSSYRKRHGQRTSLQW